MGEEAGKSDSTGEKAHRFYAYHQATEIEIFV